MSIQYRFSLGKKDISDNLVTPISASSYTYSAVMTPGKYYRYQFQLNYFDTNFLGQGGIFFGDPAMLVPENFNPTTASFPFIYNDEERQCIEGVDFGFIFSGFAASSTGQINYLYERGWNEPSENMPIGWDSISRTYQYEDTLNIFNQVFDFNLTFYGSDYQFINEFIDSNGNGTALPIRIEKSCNGVDWYDYYIGEINLLDQSTVFNVDKCTVTVKPSNISSISKLVQGKDATFNLSSYPVNASQGFDPYSGVGTNLGTVYPRFTWVDMFGSSGHYYYDLYYASGIPMPFYSFADLLTMAVLIATGGAVKVNVDYFLSGITATDKNAGPVTVIPGIVNGNDNMRVWFEYYNSPASPLFWSPQDATLSLSYLFKNLDAIYNLCMYADTDPSIGVTTLYILPKQLYMDETPILTLEPSGIEFTVNGDNAPNIATIGYTLYQYQRDQDLDSSWNALPKTFGDPKTWQSDWCWDPHWINVFTDTNHFAGGLITNYDYVIPGFILTYAFNSGGTFSKTVPVIPLRAVCYAGNLPNRENDPTSNAKRRMWTLSPKNYRNFGRGTFLTKDETNNPSLPYIYKFDYPMSEADFDSIAAGKFITLMVKGVAKLGYVLNAKRDEKSSLVTFQIAGE